MASQGYGTILQEIVQVSFAEKTSGPMIRNIDRELLEEVEVWVLKPGASSVGYTKYTSIKATGK